MSYTLLPGNAANATWQGAPAYTLPPGTAVDAAWPASSGSTGTGAAVLDMRGAAAAWHGASGSGQGVLPVIGSGEATFINTTITGVGDGHIPLSGSAQTGHGMAGSAAGQLGVAAVAAAAHGVAGVAAGGILMASAGVAIHERYELRGEVREGGVLVNRRVRAYLRSTGALVGEADTVVGKFNVNAGFSQAEHYVIPIDLGEFASDWLPPAANRIVPVLAYDLA